MYRVMNGWVACRAGSDRSGMPRSPHRVMNKRQKALKALHETWDINIGEWIALTKHHIDPNADQAAPGEANVLFLCFRAVFFFSFLLWLSCFAWGLGFWFRASLCVLFVLGLVLIGLRGRLGRGCSWVGQADEDMDSLTQCRMTETQMEQVSPREPLASGHWCYCFKVD